ncbi:MAG: hypothetical protein R3B53_02975 [Candidatus Paceibacterota bacterium]
MNFLWILVVTMFFTPMARSASLLSIADEPVSVISASQRIIVTSNRKAPTGVGITDFGKYLICIPGPQKFKFSYLQLTFNVYEVRGLVFSVFCAKGELRDPEIDR